MSAHRFSVLGRGVKWRNLVELLVVHDKTAAVSPTGQMLQKRSLSGLGNECLPSLSCVHTTVNRKLYLQSDCNINKLSRLLAVGQPSSWNNTNFHNIRFNSTAPRQNPNNDKDHLESSSNLQRGKDTQADSYRDGKQERTVSIDKHSDSDVKSDQSVAVPEENVGVIRGIYKRFKEAYKEYGKALIAVHVATSSVWFGSFYYAAASGVDIAGILLKIGASEKIIEQLQNTGLGYAAVAYLMYKLATPARYTVTIIGTQLTVKYLRTLGYMKPVPEGDSIKALWKEGRSEVKTKYDEKKGEMKEKVDDLREDFKDKAEELKDDVKDKLKDKATDMKDELKDKFGRKKGNRDDDR